MKKYTFLLILLVLATLAEPAAAQRRRYKRNIPVWYRSRFYSSVGFAAGSANYFGDLTPTTSIFSTSLKYTRTSFSAFYTHKFSPLVTVRGSLGWHRLVGDDAETADPNDPKSFGRYIRNLSFRNDIIELSGVAQFDLFPNNAPFFKRPKWSPYGFIGLGVIYTNPKAKAPVQDGGQWVALRPLHTEGQNYSPVTLVIPAGVGVRYKVSQRIDVGFEIGYRYTFTNYLDDVGGKYPNPNKLTSQLARDMSNRTQEPIDSYSGQSREQALRNIAQNFYGCKNCDDPNVPFSTVAQRFQPREGSPRGNGGGNDWYLITNFHISYILFDAYQRPRFR